MNAISIFFTFDYAKDFNFRVLLFVCCCVIFL